MVEEMQIATLPQGTKEFILGKGENVEGIIPDKIRLDEETIIVLNEIEDSKIARFTIINDMWTEVTSLAVEQEASLGNITIQVVKIEREKVTFLLK